MMDFIDRLRPSRVRFATEPEDETKTPFLNRNSAKNGAVVAASRSLYWTMYGFMFATVLLLFAILFQGRGYGLLDAKEYWTKDIIPRGNTMPIKFVKAYNYTTRDTPELRKLYSQYFLEKDVGIPVQEPEKYRLTAGYPSKDDKSVNVYIPSFIHQFHCLVLFREAWWDLRDKYENKVHTREKPETQMEKWNHVEHCMDYLRQTIKCNADTTLEAPAEHDDGQISNTDGMNVWHKCYDMDFVYESYLKHVVPFVAVKPYWLRKGGE